MKMEFSKEKPDPCGSSSSQIKSGYPLNFDQPAPGVWRLGLSLNLSFACIFSVACFAFTSAYWKSTCARSFTRTWVQSENKTTTQPTQKTNKKTNKNKKQTTRMFR